MPAALQPYPPGTYPPGTAAGDPSYNPLFGPYYGGSGVDPGYIGEATGAAPGIPAGGPVAPTSAAPAGPTPIDPATIPTLATLPVINAQGQFDVIGYIQNDPALEQSYLANPSLAVQYGSLANYALADAAANGGAQIVGLIQAGNIAVPAGATLTPNAQGVPNFNVGTSSLADNSLFPALGYQQTGGAATSGVTATNVPLEQALLGSQIPSIQQQAQDPQYAALAATLQQQEAQSSAGLASTLGQAVGGAFNGQQYVAQNPSAAAAWAAYQAGGGTQDINTWSQNYYQTTGQAAGDTPAFTESSVVSQENQAAGTAAAAQTTAAQQSAASQITALTAAIQQMQGNLQGGLAQQAAALLQNLQTLQGSISTYGSAASQALTTQINTQLGDLQTAIGSQQDALNQQLQTLQGANTTEAQQQSAALQTELQGLTAAEAPLAAARTTAAQAQASAVNIGLAQTKNAIEAQSAQQGFIGGSTMTDAALENADIAAQQNAAGAVGAAEVQNAQDQAAIGTLGAQTGAQIADTAATQEYGITGQGAQGQYDLASALATGTQNLQDTGAAGQAALENQVAQQQEGATQTNANTAYANANAGITAQYNLANQLAQGTGQVQSTEAQQTQQIAGTEAQQQQQDVNNEFGQSAAAGAALAAIPGQEAATDPAIANLANTGILDAQNVLNWWATPASTPSSQTPSTATSTTTASNAGNNLAAAGSGLLGLAGTLLKPAATTPATTPAAVTTPASSYDPYAGDGSSVLDGSTVDLTCWVARVCYGSNNPKWLQFRRWMLEKAPANLREFYLKHGPEIARHITDNEQEKSEIRALMDQILEAA